MSGRNARAALGVLAVLGGLAACGGHGATTSSDAPATHDAIGDGAAHDAAPADANVPPTASCVGLASTCGPTSTSNCCTSPLVSGGTYARSFDETADGMYPNSGFTATVSNFRLDAYEITVGRFRQFVAAGQGTQASPPAAGAGAHPNLAASGWQAIWNPSLLADTPTLTAALACDAEHQTWTTTAGANEDLPINCISWFEAMAFCIWDGGYLPTEAEWNYAATGGSDQRAYPWSSPASSTTIDCSYTNYSNEMPSYCVDGMNAGPGAVNRVGSESPKGDGKYGQADLAGNVFEWNLDWNASYVTPCDDCASLANNSERIYRGGDFTSGAINVRTAFRSSNSPFSRFFFAGARCARNP